MNKILCLLISITCSFNIVSAQISHVQVVCDPGIKIFLDGFYKGTSNAELGGYIIENIGLGDHVIKVAKVGFNAQEEKIWVQKGEVFIYRVKPFT
ncbi:hypothetical protein KAJ27_22590, partial [bacterium]|nr:hypothetical protein [bacterium]